MSLHYYALREPRVALDKEGYRSFCETEGTEVPLFMQHWWMESVCEGKQWDVAVARDGDTVVGVMPFLFGRKLGMTYILQPQLTQYSGPFYCYPEEYNRQQRIEFEKEVAALLLKPLKQLHPAFFLQNFSPLVTNWLPFYWAGFSQTTRYTYRLNDISDPDSLFETFDKEKRQRKIRRCSQRTEARFDLSPREFAEFHSRYWTGKSGHDLLSNDFIERVCATAVNRGNGVIASLHDTDGHLLMARFVAYDARCAYSLMSAIDTSLHRSGYNETLFWALIRYLSDKSRCFDFEGSMDEGIEYFYRSFGAEQIPFFEISKCDNRLFRLLMKLKRR